MHITILGNVNIWGCATWSWYCKLSYSYVACLLEQVPIFFWLSFGSCLCEFSWCGFFSNMNFHVLFKKPFVPYYSNHGLAGWLNSWNYQQTLLKYGVLFLISFHMFILWGWPWISLLTGKIFPYTHCPWTIDIHSCGRIFLFIFILALELNCLIYCQMFILTPVIFLASWMDPIFQLV